MARKTTICAVKLSRGSCDGRLIAINVLAEGLQVKCNKCQRPSFTLKMNYADYLKIKDKEDGRD